MARYAVVVVREGQQTLTLEVIAETPDEAEELALEELVLQDPEAHIILIEEFEGGAPTQVVSEATGPHAGPI